MSTKLKERFEQLEKLLKEMGELAISAIKQGCESFANLDQELASKVISDDEKLDAIEEVIESESVRTIARFQPVATDIRKLSVYFKVITDLRRIGRYGYDLALLTQRMREEQHFKKLIKLPEMARIAIQMTETALNGLFATNTESPLKKLLEEDELVDAMMEELFRELVTYTAEDPSRFTVAMYYLLAGRYLERAEDHAVSIGYYVHYMKTGKRDFNQNSSRPSN